MELFAVLHNYVKKLGGTHQFFFFETLVTKKFLIFLEN